MSSDSGDVVSRRAFIRLSAASIAIPLLPGCAAEKPSVVETKSLPLGRDQPFDTDWRFYLGSGSGFEATEFDDSTWRYLTLPHDWSIEDLAPQGGTERIGPFDKTSAGGTATGFTLGGEGWYRKHLVRRGCQPVGASKFYSRASIWIATCG
jgi:beta-galactosidase